MPLPEESPTPAEGEEWFICEKEIITRALLKQCHIKECSLLEEENPFWSHSPKSPQHPQKVRNGSFAKKKKKLQPEPLSEEGQGFDRAFL